MLVVCILFSITAVSANDNQADELNRDIISNDDIVSMIMIN